MAQHFKNITVRPSSERALHGLIRSYEESGTLEKGEGNELLHILDVLLGVPVRTKEERDMIRTIREYVEKKGEGRIRMAESGECLLLFRAGQKGRSVVCLQQHCDAVRLHNRKSKSHGRMRRRELSERYLPGKLVIESSANETLGADPFAGLAILIDTLLDPALDSLNLVGIISTSEEDGAFNVQHIDPDVLSEFFAEQQSSSAAYINLDGEGLWKMPLRSGFAAFARFAINVVLEPVDSGKTCLMVTIRGVHSDHSARVWPDPEASRGNASVMMMELLRIAREVDRDFQLIPIREKKRGRKGKRVIAGDFGNPEIDNRTLDTARILIAVSKDKEAKFRKRIREFVHRLKEIGSTDKKRLYSGAHIGKKHAASLHIDVEHAKRRPHDSYAPATLDTILKFGETLPLGVLKTGKTESGEPIVYSTVNFSSIAPRTLGPSGNQQLEFSLMYRAMDQQSLDDVTRDIERVVEKYGRPDGIFGSLFIEGMVTTPDAPAVKTFVEALKEINPKADPDFVWELGGLEVVAGKRLIENALHKFKPKGNVDFLSVPINIVKPHTKDEALDLDSFFETAAAVKRTIKKLSK